MFLLGTIQTICFGLEPTIYAEPCVRDQHRKFLKSFNIMSNSWFNEWVKELFKENEFSGLIPKLNLLFDREKQYLLQQMVDPPTHRPIWLFNKCAINFSGGGGGLLCSTRLTTLFNCYSLFYSVFM